MGKGFVLRQTFTTKRDAADRKIIAKAVAAAMKHKRTFSRYIKGLKCGLCGSRKTITEFYRFKGDKRPSIGTWACDDCGAC